MLHRNAGNSAILLLSLIVFFSLILLAIFVYLNSIVQIVSINNASVQADRSEVYAVAGGKIASVNVIDGQFVERGAVLFSLDTSALESRVDDALLQLIKIRSAIKSVPGGDASSGLKETSLVESDPRYIQARSRYRQAVSLVQEATVRAPLAGNVHNIKFTAGDTVEPDQVVLQLIDDNQLWVEGTVAADMRDYLEIGQKAQLEIADFFHLKIPARVIDIWQEGTGSTNRSGEIAVRLAPEYLPRDSVLQTGMAVSVSISSERKNNIVALLKKLTTEPVRGESVHSNTDGDAQELESALTTGIAKDQKSVAKASGALSHEELVLQRVLVANVTASSVVEKVENEASRELSEKAVTKLPKFVQKEFADEVLAVEIPGAVNVEAPTVETPETEAAEIPEVEVAQIPEVEAVEIPEVEAVEIPEVEAPRLVSLAVDNEWILSLPSALFTVQVVSGSNLQLLQQVADELPVEQPKMIYQYKNVPASSPVYALAIGLYVTREEAEGASVLLPQALVKNRPWIRTIEAIQGVIFTANGDQSAR